MDQQCVLTSATRGDGVNDASSCRPQRTPYEFYLPLLKRSYLRDQPYVTCTDATLRAIVQWAELEENKERCMSSMD